MHGYLKNNFKMSQNWTLITYSMPRDPFILKKCRFSVDFRGKPVIQKGLNWILLFKKFYIILSMEFIVNNERKESFFVILGFLMHISREKK